MQTATVMITPPTGTVTFLFTDIAGSTRLWAGAPQAMRSALERHDEILRGGIEGAGGYVFSTGGDGFAAAFARADRAVAAAASIQDALAAEKWPEAAPLQVRMGVHTGEAEERDGDYFGPAVNRAARLMAIGHGGQILCSSTTASLVEDQADLSDLGEHRLRDLDRPMHVFQVGHESFPRLRSLDAYPGNLPVQLTSFVGRERELKLVSEALTTDRLVTLTGTGGVGKTRLAVQAAAEAVPSFPDGVWLAELAAASDPDSMRAVVATALGTVTRERASVVDGIAEFIGDRRLLLILDNCEHVLDGAAELAERLLLACRRMEVLATSREALDVAGERVMRLRSLDIPPEAASAADIVQAAASRLFVERAEAAGGTIDFADTDVRAIQEVCRRLDGIPLAIELAAARTIAMTPAEVAAHLDERFRLLTGGRRAAVERHQTLRATIDWSYSVLQPTEQAVFDTLGVFPGSFDVEAAQAVGAQNGIEAWDVVDALTSLVAKSLLTAEREPGGTTRYQMLESLRHYARERLEVRGTADATRRRHARYFAGFIDRFAVGVQTADDVEWSRRFRAEFDNLRTAILWGLDSTEPADAELALRLVAVGVSTQSGGLNGVLPLAAQAADRARRADPRFRAPVLMGAAMDAFQGGDLALADELMREAMEAGVVPGTNFTGIGPLVFRLSFARSAEVSGLISEGHRLLEELGATEWEKGYYEGAAASMAALRSHLDLARDLSARALERAEALANASIITVGSYAYALAWWTTEPARARAVLEEAIPLIPSTVNEPLIHRALALVAQLRADDGEITAARGALVDAIGRAHANGDRQGMATVLARAAFVLHAAGRDEAAAVLAAVVETGLLAGLRALPRHEEPGFAALRVDVEAALGADRYAAAVRKGAALSYQEVLTFAQEAVG